MEHTTRERNTFSTKEAMRKRLERELFLLSNDIRKALEEEERLLSRLESSERSDVWAALRNNNDSSFPGTSRSQPVVMVEYNDDSLLMTTDASSTATIAPDMEKKAVHHVPRCSNPNPSSTPPPPASTKNKDATVVLVAKPVEGSSAEPQQQGGEAPPPGESDDAKISFGEFSSMDSSAKRARIRSGLQRQQRKIKSLLEQMRESDRKNAAAAAVANTATHTTERSSAATTCADSI